MHRTQILIEDPQYEFLLRESREHKLSLSELIRRLIAERMAAQSAFDDALDSITGIAEGTGEAVGRNHNRYLYGLSQS